MWSLNRIGSAIACGLVVVVIASELAACRSDDDTHIVLTTSHYLEPNAATDFDVVGPYMIEEWLLKGESNLGETWYLDFDALTGFEFEWGVEQRVRLRKEYIHPSLGSYDFHVEEVYSRSAVSLDEPFVWEWGFGYGLSSYKALERVEGEWQMNPLRIREGDAFGPRVLEPVNEDVNEQLWELYGNSQLAMVSMTLRYSGDPAEDPLTVLDVETEGELPRDPAEYD